MIYRNYFGAWGRELSDGDFACALAANGVLDRYLGGPIGLRHEDLVRPVEWRWSGRFFADADRSPQAGAQSLAEWWKGSGFSGLARIEVDSSSRLRDVDSMAMLTWIVGELSRPEVGARSVYLRVDRPSVTVGWSWPIHVGFLSDAGSVELKTRLDKHIRTRAWMQPLVSLVDAKRTGSGCDLLLLPAGVRQALSMTAGAAKPVRADCIIVFGRTDGDAGHWYRMVEGIRAAARTSGVAVVERGTDDIEEWFDAIVAGLSHNNPIDVALFEAVADRSQRPFIAISRRLAEFSRLSMQLRRTATRLKRPGTREMTVEIAPGSPEERTLNVGAGTRTLDSVGDSLEAMAAMGESEIGADNFLHERGAATGSAGLNRSLARPRAAAAPPPPTQKDRMIQAEVFDVSNPVEAVRRTRQFRGGAKHQIVVRIGEKDERFIASRAGPVFPVDALPQDQDEWELTAVLSIAQSSDDPQVSRILLPRYGNSSEATFFVYVKEEWKNVEARIIVCHRNRVIQTAMLAGKVGGSKDVEEEGDQQITLEPEIVVRRRFENLGVRERFDAALVMNKSKAGIERILGLADDKVAKLTPGQTLNDEIKNIDEILTEIVDNPKSFMGKLTAKPVVEILKKLAQHGRLLHDYLVVDGDLKKVGLDGDGPLQVISAVPDARMPIELAYARRAPTAAAKMCPGAAASLRKGECSKACNKLEESAYICPLAFWGVRRVIERHAPDTQLKKVTAGDSFALLSEPSDLRPTLDLFTAGLVAGSQKVDKTVAGGLEEICDVVGKLTTSSLKPVADWNGWTSGIAKTGPSLLVLIVHTEETPNDSTIPQMEIGEASWLPVSQLEQEHVMRTGGSPPLVLLLGCETGVPDRQFANFVTRVRLKGAAIVVATGAKIHSLHAVPVAKEFVTRIQETAEKNGDATFGEVMLAVRRQMLADGIPMVLTLNAFGDADWRLAKHT